VVSDVTSCSDVGDRLFWGPCCPHFQGEVSGTDTGTGCIAANSSRPMKSRHRVLCGLNTSFSLHQQQSSWWFIVCYLLPEGKRNQASGWGMKWTYIYIFMCVCVCVCVCVCKGVQKGIECHPSQYETGKDRALSGSLKGIKEWRVEEALKRSSIGIESRWWRGYLWGLGKY